MKENPVKRELERGGLVVGSFLVEFATRGIARLLAAAGAEFVIYDQEHTGWSIEKLAPLLDSSHAAGVVPLVRVPAAERHLIAAVLDAGAMGVMVPSVESAEQAREIVAEAKYPPDGRRGVGPMHEDELDADLPTTLARINREQLVFAMVETRAGVEHVDEIAAVDGIDLLWIGHGDLSASLGIPGRLDDRVYLDAVDAVFEASRAHGKPLGMMAASIGEGRQLVERGFRCVAFADRPLYDRALREAQAAARDAASR